ncbi:PD-(D/E)XK nuclease-like domain-containing protein [Micromonospora sp. MED01]|uniref:PD-(D/E)XK nuclease-like domain-containing protein n=1 Tax=Micromonospora alfalfae TaxID=2911212 RepID=UPI001EE8CDB0|nr:PD-(D/E)XK nuclease-like domain-containing protein [Micromonospora alfalfae]MCG5460817.1 PD-(D/E)XK nuclease-like domain-containing protein [Micromonospora alfalfae]
MTTAVVEVTEPGIHDGMPDEVYHRDPVPAGSLSSSGARRLLKTCPAKFDYERRNPPAPTKTFDIGHAAHQMILGTGPELVVVPGARWDTNDAKAQVAAVRERGGIPLKQADMDQIRAMADAILADPLAAAMLSVGEPERSLFWVDERTGIWRRARLDWYRDGHIVDLKTCESADEEAIRRDAARYGYHAQDEWYREGVRAVGLCPDPSFTFIFVEKAAPHLTHVVQLGPDEIAAGRHLNNKAIDRFAECQRTGVWPGYASDITTISLPPYALRALEF